MALFCMAEFDVGELLSRISAINNSSPPGKVSNPKRLSDKAELNILRSDHNLDTTDSLLVLFQCFLQTA